MILAELLPEAAIEPDHRDLAVTGVAVDSRAVKPGDVFFAVPGAKTDGSGFAGAAATAGAIAVVAERRPEGLPGGLATIVVPDVRRALSAAAARFYPRQPETIVAVTGTSGKTSVTAFVRQIWASAGFKAASLGTIGIVGPDRATEGALTTPDAVTLHRTLDGLARDGITHLAVEASSHGLAQHRLDGVRLAAAAFTNLSRDHLDYHANLDDYLAAKLRLFTDLLRRGQPAVVADDGDPPATKVVAAAQARGLSVVTVGRAGDALYLISATPDGFATRLRLVHESDEREILLPLSGLFQVSNALVAAGLCLATGTPAGTVFAALGKLEGAPGRLERVGEVRGAPIFVDYAHKPDALEKVLATLRPYVTRRLVVVFGCGGDRDVGKRPLMGEIACRLADVVIVTDDNPRSEDPAKIRAAILAACPGALEIGDRAEAIRAALGSLGPGDILIVAGKGHENGQEVDGVKRPFSDKDAVAAAIGDIIA